MIVSKAFKKNKTMIISLSLAGGVALGLIVYLGIKLLEWSEYRDRTQTAIQEIQKLVNQKPAPGRENEDRIQNDIALYEEKSNAMIGSFRSPLDKALNAFFEELQPPRAAELTEEEIEEYKVEGTGIEGDEETPAVPLKIRKFTRDEFVKFFSERFEKFCEENGIEEDDRRELTILNQFRTKFIRLFPDGNWRSAINKFAETARLSFNEPIEISNTQEPLPLLMQALGLERRVGDRPYLHVENIIKSIIVPAAKDKIVLGPKALEFIGGYSANLCKELEIGGGNYSPASYRQEEYPAVYFHWEVYGDIVKRMVNAKVKSLEQVKFRALSAESSDEENSRNQNSVQYDITQPSEEDGNYKLYHYTLVFTGNMTAVREALRQFDLAWKTDSRMYIVRGIALYARHDGAAEIIGQQEKEVEQGNSYNQQEQSVRRGRRGRRVQSEQINQPDEKIEENKPFELTREIHYRVILKRRSEAGDNDLATEYLTRLSPTSVESDGEKDSFRGEYSSGNAGREENIDEILNDLEKELQPHEIFGYGKSLVGSDGKTEDDCLVYLDVDYVVLNQQK